MVVSQIINPSQHGTHRFKSKTHRHLLLLQWFFRLHGKTFNLLDKTRVPAMQFLQFLVKTLSLSFLQSQQTSTVYSK